MAKRGERYVNGRLLILVQRHMLGFAKEAAMSHAKRLRDAGQFVRVFKVNTYTYDVFAL